MSNLSRRHALTIAGLGTMASYFAGPSLAAAAAPDNSALYLLNSDPRFTFWIQTVKFAGLERYFSGNKKFTVFVPTNNAFSRYPEVLAELTRIDNGVVYQDTTNQAEFIRAHIISGLHPLADFSGKSSTLLSIAETPITIDGTTAGSYRVTWVSVQWRPATAQIIDAPIIASNALVYPFDSVIIG